MKVITSTINFIKFLLNGGVTQGQEPHHRIVIQIINLICIIGILLSLVTVVVLFIGGFRNFFSYHSSILYSSLCAIAWYLNYRKYYDGATAMTTIVLASYMFFNVYYFEIDSSNAELLFFPLAIAAPLAFRRKWVGIIGFIYIVFLLGIIIWSRDSITSFITLFNIMLIASGVVISTSSIIRHLSISARELKKTNEKLKEQNKQQEELIIQNNLKTELLGILAHDLKGPASSFNQLSKKVAFLMKKGRIDELEKHGEYFELAGERIYREIDRLLNWTIAQKEKIVIRDIEFLPYDLIQRIVNNLEFQFKKKAIQFKNNIPQNFVLTADWHILEIILKNLLNNSANHIQEGECVTITSLAEPNFVAIIIHNPGSAIDNEVVEQAKAGRYRKSKNGHGLGLGICFSLIQFLEGTLSFDTTSKSGTVAVVKLPVK